MYSKFILLLAALLAATLWFGCEDEGKIIERPPYPYYSPQIVTELPNDTLRFFAEDSVMIWVTVIVTDGYGRAFPGQAVDISLSDPSLGVIEYTDYDLLDTTNALGRVNMLFHSFAIAGEQIITATVSGIVTKDTLTAIEVPRPLSGFTLASDRPHDTIYVAPDSELVIHFTANFFDADANPVSDYDGIFISSSATGGQLERFSVISNGQATSTWSFHNEYGPFQARIFGNWLDPFTILPDTTG